MRRFSATANQPELANGITSHRAQVLPASQQVRALVRKRPLRWQRAGTERFWFARHTPVCASRMMKKVTIWVIPSPRQRDVDGHHRSPRLSIEQFLAIGAPLPARPRLAV